MDLSVVRTRWAAIGAAVAVTLGAGGIGISHAVIDSGERPVFIPIEPCRLAFTTSSSFQVGPRSAPLGPGETYTLDGWGSVGNCTLPSSTTGLALNVTALEATELTNLRFFPADAASVPTAANLNPAPGQPPTPNAVTVDLDSSGQFSVFNAFGNVEIVVDVVGYLEHHTHDDRMLAATVAPANSAAVLVRGVGALSVSRLGTGYYSVTFDRDVSNCVWVATYGQPDNNSVNDVWATTRGGTEPDEVRVVLFDDAGLQVDGAGFHLVVVCPPSPF